jgi:hypothetical protein
MSLSLYDISIPVFITALRNLSHNLHKGEAYAAEQGIAEVELTTARLFPDMLPLTGQIQRASDTARFVAVRVGQTEPRPMADNEVSLADLQARIAATIDYLSAVAPDSMDGRETSAVSFKAGPRTLNFTGTSYILGFALPNFYFHVTTAYAILRHKGVPLGKTDFLAGASPRS